jgi:hypothetical protein
MGVDQLIIGRLLNSGEELERCEFAAWVWKVIPQVDSVLNCERPEAWALLIQSVE